jgi:hypothetical protein
MKLEPKLKQRPARWDGRLGARVSANLSGLWRLACLMAQRAVGPAQAPVLEVGLSKPPRSSPGRLRRRHRQQNDFQMVRPNLQNMHVGEFSPSLRHLTIALALLHCQK